MTIIFIVSYTELVNIPHHLTLLGVNIYNFAKNGAMTVDITKPISKTNALCTSSDASFEHLTYAAESGKFHFHTLNATYVNRVM